MPHFFTARPALRIIALTAIVLLASCASLPPGDGKVEDVDLSSPDEERLYIPQSGRDKPEASQAVEQLLASANAAIDEGNYARAAALAERAIRLSPNDGRPYFGLAQVHFYQNEDALGRSFLARAKALAAGDSRLLHAIEQFRQSYGL